MHLYSTNGDTWHLTRALVNLRDVVERSPFVDAHYHLGKALLKISPDEASRQLSLAAGMIEAAKKANAPVDSELEKKILEAWKKARMMLDAKAQAPSP